MKEIIFFSLLFLICCSDSKVIENHYQPDKETLARLRVTYQKMGPYKQYRLEPDGTLQVKVEGRWLRIGY